MARSERRGFVRVLVIDDDHSIGTAIQILLNREGCDVVLARSGSLGIAAAKASQFDAAMVDIFMPGVDGIETIKTIRQITQNLPIIAMTGFRFAGEGRANPDYLKMAVALGATSFLRKPFGPEALKAAICSLPEMPISSSTTERDKGVPQ